MKIAESYQLITALIPIPTQTPLSPHRVINIIFDTWCPPRSHGFLSLLLALDKLGKDEQEEEEEQQQQLRDHRQQEDQLKSHDEMVAKMSIQPDTAFDIASLILFGTSALPIRLKILLDKVFATLTEKELSSLLNRFGWTRDDYARGYITVSLYFCIILIISLIPSNC